MIHRFFAKKDFEQVDYYLEEFFRALELDSKEIKRRKQVASYAKPYSLLLEAVYQGRNIILSFRQSKLGQKKKTQQLEIILPIENKSWLFLDIYPATNSKKKQKKLDTITIPFLDVLAEKEIVVDTNNKYFVLEVFDDVWCEKWLALSKFGFEQVVVERQKIYLKTGWIPEDYSKTRVLLELFLVLMELAKEIEK